MDQAFIETLWITCKLATLTSLILLLVGLPFSYFLAFSQFRLKPLIEALVSMPLVLPPSVMGYYLLLAYSPRYWFGDMLNTLFNVKLAFSFEGILIASVIFSLPFMIQPLQNGLRSLPTSFREASYTLGKSRTVTYFKVLLPNIRSSLITALALTFAHSIGEFGIILMVGGSMPGETRVASIAIYDEVQSLNFAAANKYALILFVVSFTVLVLIYSLNRKQDSWKVM
jgi:molybdate transport system permease protein